MKPREVVGGTQSTWEVCQRDKNLAARTGGESERLEMVEVPQRPVMQQEQHIFILTKSVFQVAFRVLFCEGPSLIKLQIRQGLSSRFIYQYPSLSSCCHLILWHASSATHSYPHMASRSPLLAGTLVIMMPLFCDSMKNVFVYTLIPLLKLQLSCRYCTSRQGLKRGRL